MKCIVEVCNNESYFKSTNFCRKHYKRWRRHGTTDLHPKYQQIEFKKNLIKEGKSICGICKEIKSLDDFSKVKSRLGKIRWSCKECNNKNNKLNERAIKNNYLKRKYNINIEYYETLLVKQKQVCAICKQQETAVINKKIQIIRSLAVDHDHETGQIRGLLCSNCNHALGQLKDNIDLFKLCITYLQEYGK